MRMGHGQESSGALHMPEPRGRQSRPPVSLNMQRIVHGVLCSDQHAPVLCDGERLGRRAPGNGDLFGDITIDASCTEHPNGAPVVLDKPRVAHHLFIRCASADRVLHHAHGAFARQPAPQETGDMTDELWAPVIGLLERAERAAPTIVRLCMRVRVHQDNTTQTLWSALGDGDDHLRSPPGDDIDPRQLQNIEDR